MRDVFVVADNIISPLGETSRENFAAVSKGLSGIRLHEMPLFSDQKFYASLLEDTIPFPGIDSDRYTKFEQLLIGSIHDALRNTGISLNDERCILIISTTKGNISLIEDNPLTASIQKRVSLNTSGSLVGDYFDCAHEPLVVSNACISGLLAIMYGQRLISSGQYDHAVVAGADIISKFVLSGFQSFQAISAGPCKPFDAKRNGINLGEGAGTVILSSDAGTPSPIQVRGGSVSNDANHISGPSRTGKELCQAMVKAMKASSLVADDIGFISAHGTATLYNDEMEALAIAHANLLPVPVNSLKGFYGHTLGAAGIIESIISLHSLNEGLVLPTHGFGEHGVSQPVKVSGEAQPSNKKNCLKTASGFGGCNAAVVFSKQ